MGEPSETGTGQPAGSRAVVAGRDQYADAAWLILAASYFASVSGIGNEEARWAVALLPHRQTLCSRPPPGITEPGRRQIWPKQAPTWNTGLGWRARRTRRRC